MDVNCSESDVEPRISANNMDISTSAPPGNFLAKSSHTLQKCGFRLDCRRPYSAPTAIPPIPWNGARQSLQRGSCGRRRKKPCRRFSTAKASVMNQSCHSCSTLSLFTTIGHILVYLVRQHSAIAIAVFNADLY